MPTVQVKKIVCEWMAWIMRMKRPGQEVKLADLLEHKDEPAGTATDAPSSLSIIENLRDLERRHFRPPSGERRDFSRSPPPLSGEENPFRSALKSEVGAILEEIRFITAKIRDDVAAEEEVNDWKWAAMVIDRACLWVFLIYLVVTTGAVFVKAPYIFGGDVELLPG